MSSVRHSYSKKIQADIFCLSAAFALVLALAYPAGAYPEFQAYSQENSGMGVSCAMCHVNPDGPEGANYGQIGGLSREAMEDLSYARTAFDPGVTVKSPILNAFGNDMIRQLGRKKIIELKQTPEGLTTALDPKGDLDDDGVPDGREYSEGTHPLHKSSGNPILLFAHNFKGHLFPTIMVILAIFCLLYGFKNLHAALDMHEESSEDDFLNIED